ncbi:unnamed protein product [Blepharisma stoltei]|uniref:Tetratricopeptide repeat protein n=1 Tax=Blepharisma stoltei TaxID=1481888 RepID=A0AAU9J8U3_9CILI|nr:unnamed protein product [Blepharisma stoltei]
MSELNFYIRLFRIYLKKGSNENGFKTYLFRNYYMMAKKCFKPGCMNEVEYACKCSFPETLLCIEHIGEHEKLPNRVHNVESIFMQPCEGTKEAILEFLTKENSKFSELRKIIIDSSSQCLSNSEKDLGDFLSKLDCYVDEINHFFAKISQATNLLKSEQDPILRLLSLQPQEAIEKMKLMTIASRDWYNGAKLFYIFNQKLESLNRSFFTEIFKAYLEKRDMQNASVMHNKTSKPTSIESANVKASLLNSHISNAANDLKRVPNKTESALNDIDILRNKTAEILSRPNNPKLEKDFRATCSAIQTHSSLHDPPLMQAYQDYLKAYQQKTSLYNIAKDNHNRVYLHIYNSETETLEDIFLQNKKNSLDSVTCITQVPNGKLFCFGNGWKSGITVLIDADGEAEILPSGTPCGYSSCIYFKNSVYCFGGFNNELKDLSLSIRFDLDQNRWIQLTPMPRADYGCNSIIFNGNILISGVINRNLLLYSIDINSFSTIPYEFTAHKRKILINEKRLYLIECPNGSIYESEIGSYLNWRRISESKINCVPDQIYCSYNKGFICISTISASSSAREYYYFNLWQKNIIDVAYYNTHVSIKRVGNKIEAIRWFKQNKIDPYYLNECNAKGIALSDLGKNLEEIECIDQVIKINPKNANYYNNKGKAFYDIKRYREAIKCYERAIILNQKEANFYNNKGKAFYDLKRYLEAIKCYDEAIKFNPNDADLYNNKGDAFYSLGRYLEAIECHEEAIKLNPSNSDSYYKKGYALNELGRYPEALESYEEAIKIKPYKAKYYNDKGTTLYVLERYQEAIQCYNKAMILEPNNPLHFCNRARVFNNLRKEVAALQDFNRAYNLRGKNQENVFITRNEWNLSEKEINFINDLLGQDRIELRQKSRFRIKFGYNKPL